MGPLLQRMASSLERWESSGIGFPSTRHLKFLLTWQEFLDQGLPCERLSRVDLVGEPSSAGAECWRGFVDQLEASGRVFQV